MLATAQLVLSLDYSIVNVALPSIGGSLGFSRDSVEWVVSAYALLFGGFLLLGGRSSDLLGRRRVFIASGALFGVASMLGGLSTTPALLLLGRAVQGLAAGFLFPATLSLVTTTFPEGPSRNRAISVWGAAGASGLAFGAFLGGLLLSALGWRWVFFVNVPVLAILVVAAPLVLPGWRPPRPRVGDFDVPGATTVTAGAMLVVLALVQAPVLGWSSPGTVGLLAYDLLGPRLSLPTLLAGEAIAGFGQGITFTTAYLVAESAAGDVRALVLDCKRLLREWRLPPGSPTRRCAGRSPG